MQQPSIRPNRPFFSSGPAVKRPGWSHHMLGNASLGRSHRAPAVKNKINQLVQDFRDLLNIPANYLVAITPGSDTCAIEMAMWSLLGPKGVDVLVFDLFGSLWETDILKQLKLPDVRVFKSENDQLPDLQEVSPDRDVVFCWNGTTSGMVIPEANWISSARTGLTFCDAISAVFAYDMPWDKLDVTSFSLQKGLGGEAQHGVLVLSPAAVERLNSYIPAWPVPRLFRMTKAQGGVNHAFFTGDTINTPSALVIEDALDATSWCKSQGGLPALMGRVDANMKEFESWVAGQDWIDFRIQKQDARSKTSVCFTMRQNSAESWVNIQKIAALLEKEEVAFDIKGHALDKPCFRFWGGPMVDQADIKAVLPWLSWAYHKII